MTAIKYALDSHWENTLFAIIIAACFDVLDGATVVSLKATSRFGAELTVWQMQLTLGLFLPSLFILAIDNIDAGFDSYYLGWTWVACTLFTALLVTIGRFNIMDQGNSQKICK